MRGACTFDQPLRSPADANWPGPLAICSRSTICVPEPANPVKVASMRGLGAELVLHGRDYDEARERCERLAHERGYRYVHSGNESLLIAGVATETLAILEEQPRIEVIIVPVGGGSGAAGACIVAKAVNPALRIIGVQSEAAPAAVRSWQERRLVEDRMETFAEGLAPRTAFGTHYPRSSFHRGSSGNHSTTSSS